MPTLPDREILLRRMFLFVGYFLLLGTTTAVDRVLQIQSWADLLFPTDDRHYRVFMATVHLGAVVAGLLCIVTAWGMKRDRAWSRWTGVYASALMLMGIPWFTVVGVIGVYELLVSPPKFKVWFPAAGKAPAKVKRDYWTARRGSRAQTILLAISALLFFPALGRMGSWAQERGMPGWSPDGLDWMYLSVFLLFQTCLHELGHTCVAWTLDYRFRAISIGPFTCWHDGHGYQFRIEWARFFDASGFAAGIPGSTRDLRQRHMAVAAAGPLVSLLTGLFLLGLFLGMPGTRWQAYWWIAACNAVLGIGIGVFNLLPVGCSDGSMLFHLAFWTAPGQQLVDRLTVMKTLAEAEDCHHRADFEAERQLLEKALQDALKCDASSLTVAACHQALGSSKLAAGDWLGAEVEFRKCLGYEAECAFSPPMAANATAGLQSAYFHRHHTNETLRIYNPAVTIIEAGKTNRNRTGLAVSRALLAQVYTRAHRYDKALEEAAEACKLLPQDRSRLLLLQNFYSLQAVCCLHQGMIEPGLANAGHAARIARSGDVAPDRNNLAWEEVATMAVELWHAGQATLAAELLREAIGKLEAAGAVVTAARHRIHLATALRHAGLLSEAVRYLPKQSGLPPHLRRGLLAEAAQLHLAAGRHKQAVADGRELLGLWQTEDHPPAAEVAVAEGLLARAYLETGDYGQAETLARRAADVLGPWRHPDAAGCLVTVALARWQSTGVWIGGMVEEALRLLQEDPLLSRVGRARRLDAETCRLERFSRPGEARRMAEAIPAQFRASESSAAVA